MPTILLRALAALLVAAAASAQVVRPAPAARGPAVEALAARVGALREALPRASAAPTLASLSQAFARTVAPVPATPADFAARAALVEAFAKPETGVAELSASLDAAGGKQALKAAATLRRVGAFMTRAPEEERKAFAASAAELSARFDGATAARDEFLDMSAVPTKTKGPGKSEARKEMKRLRKKVMAEQEKLYAERHRSVLVKLQSSDTGGKDGIEKRPLRLNPAYMTSRSYKAPTPAERAEPYEARHDRATPRPDEGLIGVHNRTDYENVIVPTMKLLLWELSRIPEKDLSAATAKAVLRKLHLPDGGRVALTKDVRALIAKAGEAGAPKLTLEQIEARYAEILAHEREQAAAGVIPYKVFLHVSEKVQGERMEARKGRRDKEYKYSDSDAETHALFGFQQRIYAAVLARTSAIYAPWTIVPADHKARRDLAFERGFLGFMKGLDLDWPVNPEARAARRARR